MRLQYPHRRSIRAKLLALLVLPLASTVGMWAFGAASALGDAWSLTRVAQTYQYFGEPVDDVVEALQAERRSSVAYLAGGGRDFAGGQMATDRERTTRAVTVLREHAADTNRLEELDGRQRARLARMVKAVEGIGALRDDVQYRDIPWDEALKRYSEVIEPSFKVRSSLGALRSGDLAARTAVVNELVRGREMLSREDAMITAGQTAGNLTQGQYHDLVGTIDSRRLLYGLYAPELPAPQRALYEDFTDGPVGSALEGMEAHIRAAGAEQVGSSVMHGHWRATLDASLNELAGIDRSGGRDIGERARDDGVALLVSALASGGVGLLAVAVSIAVSVRISRDLGTRLTALRDEALALSGTRLPEVMHRLRRGDENVDTGLDAPVLNLGHDEIGQVGRAFGTVQRAAVEAALDQARLRRGVSAVFTNLARRSQVLLHRQLTLLDTMERRAQDPVELEDLFRLDHMTTRMRRHAEGLLILSGNVPGRAWRRPVRMVEVVRAAVGEVEDYPRVAVRRMPRVALNGPAVADVLHLLAELIENATAFSPPETKVTVRGERVPGGFVLEISDRGLGMSRERLEEANRRLCAVQDFDLPDTDRLGLFTVGRLAARQGVRVTLRAAEDRGTVAVVLVPQTLLVVPDGDGEDAETGEFRAGPDTGGRTAVPAGAPAGAAAGRSMAAAGPAAAVPEPFGAEPGTGVPALPRRRPPVLVREPAAADGPAGPAPAPGAPAPLPRRRRQEVLSSQLRDVPPQRRRPREGPAGAHTEDRGGERSAEDARSTMAAFARGTARGRERSERAADGAAAVTTAREGDGG
ncbi:HAMP domain-containing protein [Streptomyces sp. SCUT-3]|uniref:sensor histidine kinase n=2 Tax=unclassified Streptomyces TaxID=2593676 RepID=UPI0015FBC0A1|nr:nitrate- and nitrite sensing domain-containing protein [Streptomyces sp. SCUT-3]QMV20898.1 HAMP domain-containing protein [Streptomyces sp. SCUT-3]